MNNELPGGWAWSTIGGVADVQLGRQRSPQHHHGEQMRPYLRSANVTWDGISLDDVKEMNFDDADFEKYCLAPGDLLLNEASGSPNEVGKPAIWTGELEGCCFQNTLLRLRPHGVDRGYLFWFCYYAALTGRFGEAGRGVNIRHLGKRGLAAFPISVAPGDQQRRIVDWIEEHMSRLDSAAAAADAARAKADALAPIALQGLFSSDWPVRQIAEVARVGSGATPKRSEPRYWTGGTIPWVNSGAVNSRSIAAPSELITAQALEETSVKLWPRGTVLVAMYGEGQTRGRAARLEIESTCNQACAAIDFDRSLVNGDYLLAFLNARYEASRKLASGGVQPNLSIGLVKSMEIPIPDLDTQGEVARRAETVVLESVRLAKGCAGAVKRSGHLRRAVLAAAFSGRWDFDSNTLDAVGPSSEPSGSASKKVV
ncbi:MAG: hypothetical protein DHS20C19_00120 [Acidimicrobiales bacterium]|nr:MAG: hypothetical protein DHS20C19_00120 [Acidimicrobiales bacterium]